MEATLTVNHPFVLEPSQIQRIWSFLQSEVGTVAATATTRDRTERTFQSVDEVLNYENSSRRALERLRFSAQKADGSRAARLSFGGHRIIEGMVAGPDDSAVALRDRLEDIVAGTKPWYAGLARLNFFWIIAIPMYAALLVLQAMGTPSDEIQSASEAALNVLFLAAVIGALAALIWCLNRLRARVFPLATFAVGQGAQRHRNTEKVRWTVVVGLVVSVSASLLVNLL